MPSYELALQALRSLEPGEKPNIALVARTYGVNASHLSKRYRGVSGSKQAQYNNQRLLNEEQSKTLIKYINRLTEQGLPPTYTMLANFARDITGKEPGKNWATRWLKSHSDELISRYSMGLDLDRKKADSAWKYTLYFELLGRKIEQYNLTPDQIWNMDEKGFLLGIVTREKRIFSKTKYEDGGYKQNLQDGNREWITTIACICANGNALSPSLIYMAKTGNIQESWLQDFDPKKQRCFFAASESGWTNNELGMRWLIDVFDKETKHQASRGWRLLIVDGHGSHLNMSFLDYCDKNRILLAIFPAHATHTLQPLDVALFRPLSKAYSAELDRFIHDSQGISRIRKCDFFRLFWASWHTAFTKENILSAFKNTGLCPFNPDIVVQRFTKKAESRPTSSESNASIIPAEDWRRLRKTVAAAVSDVYDKKARQLNSTLQHLATENILLKMELEGLKRTLITIQKRQSKKKPLLLNMPSDSDGGAIFFSPSKVQQARDLQFQKDQEAAHEQAQKEDKKLQQKLAKEAKEFEKLQKAQIRQKKREERLQEAAIKQQQKDEEELAKLADLQLQNNVSTPSTASKSPKKKAPKQAKQKPCAEPPKEENMVVITTNRRGRAIRPPSRFRD
jgi:hypothetical protein